MATATVSETQVPTEPGIYKNLRFETYYAIQAISHSILEGFVPPKTPAHGREAWINPEPQTEAMAFGQALHTALLEPERFEIEYVTAPKCDKRTNVGKAAWAEFEAAHKGKNYLLPDEREKIEAMVAAAMKHGSARELLTRPGHREYVFVWKDQETGLLCKARLDLMVPHGDWTYIIDVKTCVDASEREFPKAIHRYGYGRQLAWYRRAAYALAPRQRRCAFLAMEKTRPYCVAVHELEERALMQGDRENTAALATIARCVSENHFPGYEDGMTLVDLPAWGVNNLDE